MDRRPAPRRDLPVDDPGWAQLRHRAHPLSGLAAAGMVSEGNGVTLPCITPTAQVIGTQGGVRPGAAGQRGIRPAGRPGVRGPDPRGAGRGYRQAGRSHRQPPGRRLQHGRPGLRAPRASRSCGLARYHGGDRSLRGRVDVRVPRALAQGFRGRSPSRSRLARLPDHRHLPVHSGHDPVAGRGSDGSVMAKAAFRRRPGQASRTWPARWTTGSSLLHGKLIQRSVRRQT
jgi:hypothetical protein